MKYAIFVCTFVFLGSMVYPLSIYPVIENLVSRMGTPDQLAALRAQQSTIILLLAICEAAVVGLVFIVCIFQSHKVAGPMYKLHKFFQNVAAGNPPEKLFFRKGDHFHEIAVDFNEAFDKVKESYNEDFAYLSEVNSYIQNLSIVVPEDKRPVIEEITKRLNEIQNRFKNR